MTAFKLLSEPIRKYVRDKGWESLRPIQAAAISKITSTDGNYILASRTASGKTEAAFLPILSKTDFNQAGVQVLYISPLIALINDQFMRVEDLCKNLEIRVTKWHGEAKRSLKKELIQNPNGIVLITPESLEAMFVNAPYQVSGLFGNLKYIVLDEIHSFLGVDRGLQLMSLLSRIQQVNKERIITIGLSATIGDENFVEAKRLIGSIENTKVLVDRTPKETEARFKYFEGGVKELPLGLLKDLYKETAAHKVLIFPNSRGRTEEIAVKLRKISDRVGGHPYYYTHHSSVDKEIRENIERFAKENKRFNFCIACTSTLELGIDIGTVDQIVQVDSTHSVASLVQRIGRSGRTEGEKSKLNMYATDKWSLLQSLACWQLYQTGFLEPISTAKKPYDILLHQMLSIAKQLSGCSKADLSQRLSTNATFRNIDQGDIDQLIDHAIASDYLEVLQHEIILGVEGEKIVNSREFYSVFTTDPMFKVIYSGNKIGDIPLSIQVQVDQNIILAARIWKIKDIDLKSAKIAVVPAKDGQKPMFFGGGGTIHPRIRQEMLRILKTNEIYPELDERCGDALAELRYDFKDFEINNFAYDRPFIGKENEVWLYTFTGSKINNSLAFLIRESGYQVTTDDHHSLLQIQTDLLNPEQLKSDVNHIYKEIDRLLTAKLEENDTLIGFSKWGSYLPVKFQYKILQERYFDFEGALQLINGLRFIKPT